MKPTKRKAPAVAGHEPAFREIIGLIAAARRRAFQSVNTELIDLYWRVVSARVSPLVTQISFRSKVAALLRQIQPAAKTLGIGERISLTPDFSRVLRSQTWIETVLTVLLRDGKPLKRFSLLGRRNHPAKAGC